MKDQLQLQEIAGYLPYQLRYCFDNHKYYGLENLADPISPRYDLGTLVRIGKMDLIYPISVEWDDPKNGLASSFKFENDNFKPIIRPMSDLEDNVNWLTKMTEDVNHYLSFHNGLFSDSMTEDFTIEWIPQACFKWLLENHFDVFDLMGRGLAININDLPPIKD